MRLQMVWTFAAWFAACATILICLQGASDAAEIRRGMIASADAGISDLSAQRRRTTRQPRSSTRIACTLHGCHRVPPGCYPVPGRDWRNRPTGFDVIVCPRRPTSPR